MTTHVVNTHDAKSRLSELVLEAERGNHVIVTRNGKPVAKIVAWTADDSTRLPGAWAGQISYNEELG